MMEGVTNSTSRRVPMRVLVLGLSRTSTSSMQQALKQLGYPNVYHTRTVLTDRPGDGYKWAELLERKFVKRMPIRMSEWDSLLGDFDAVTDVPCAIFWEELLAAYPDAKVILTVRDSADAWYASYASTIGYLTSLNYAHSSSPMSRWFTRWVLGETWSGFDEMIAAQVRYTPRGRIHDEAATKRWYEEHNRAVRAAVPDDGRLLVFNAKQGWESLCRFLEQPVPDSPYPRVFEKEEYLAGISARFEAKKSKRMRRLLMLGAISLSLIAGARIQTVALQWLPGINKGFGAYTVQG